MQATDRRYVAVPCKLMLGGFSGERIFEVTLANGGSYRGVAPRQFCWNEQGQLLQKEEPAAESPGLIAARVIDRIEDGQVVIEVPDGENIAVDDKVVKNRPTQIRPPAPKSHVPV